MLKEDFSISALVAGFLTVLVAYAGPLLIVFQAAKNAHLSTEMISSWLWAISLGSGITGLILSWKYKVPIIAAWSTPGAALLLGLLHTVTIHEAVGAYIVSAVIITIIGMTGAFNRLIKRLPKGIAAAMLAGILLKFGMEIFVSIKALPGLVLTMLAVYLLTKRLVPRYAIAAVLLLGILFAMVSGETHLSVVSLAVVKPVFIMPEWTFGSVLGLGLPLALVTLSGQYVPGIAVLKASGYKVSANSIMTVTGFGSILFSFFGAHSVNLAAITAAICTGKEAHEDPQKRYIAGIASGVFYITMGIFGGTLVLLFSALPKELVATLAGLALIGAITTGLVGIVQDESQRESSIITFLVTASGMSFLGLGSSFWGLVIGGVAYMVLHKKWKKTPTLEATKT